MSTVGGAALTASAVTASAVTASAVASGGGVRRQRKKVLSPQAEKRNEEGHGGDDDQGAEQLQIQQLQQQQQLQQEEEELQQEFVLQSVKSSREKAHSLRRADRDKAADVETRFGGDALLAEEAARIGLRAATVPSVGELALTVDGDDDNDDGDNADNDGRGGCGKNGDGKVAVGKGAGGKVGDAQQQAQRWGFLDEGLFATMVELGVRQGTLSPAGLIAAAGEGVASRRHDVRRALQDGKVRET